MKNNHFYSWLKTRTEKKPSSQLDRKILSHAALILEKKSSGEKNIFIIWKLSSAAALASVALLVVLINRGPTTRPSMMINEAPEMILNYNEIELMAEASVLSESDWARINE